MMHTMMRRCIENVFKPTHFIDRLGVNPELIQRYVCRHDCKIQCTETKEGEGQTKGKRPHYLKRVLA